MKRLSFMTLLIWVVLFLVLSSCAPATIPISTPTNLASDSLHSTKSPVAPTDVPTSTPVPPTEAPSLIPLPTHTPTTTPPAPKQTTALSVNVNNLSNYSFDVRANSDLFLSDVSGDGRQNDCTIAPTSGTGTAIRITIPATGSVTFQLAVGNYKLYCGNPSVYATLRVTN